ncbi:MAG: hypothetical protein AAGG11_17320 [Pseudomonadota bacterium]
MSDTVIDRVRVAAAHDGVAELVVVLRHGNGGLSEVALDHAGASALLRSAGVGSADELAGASWVLVRDALTESWNRN